MSTLRTLPTFKKILWRSVLAPIVAGLISCALFVSLTLYLADSHNMVEHTEKVLAASSNLQRMFLDTETSVRGYVITGNEEFLDRHSGTADSWETELKAIQTMVSDNPIQAQRLREVETTFRTYLNYAERAIAARRVGFADAAKIVATREGKNAMDQIRLSWIRFDNMERDLLADRSAKAKTAAQIFMSMLVAGTLLISFFIAVWGRKQVVDLSKSYEDLTSDQMRKNQILEHNQWLRHNQSQLVALMLGKLNLSEFGDRIVGFLARVLDAQAGTLFVKAENGEFKRIAQMGLAADADAPKQFQADEGLLGTAVKSRKIEAINDLPANYFRLGSGLGSTDAKHLILTPLRMRGEEVVGTLELGFLAPPPPKVMEFLETVTDSLGTGIQSILDNFKLEKLYHEVQNQAEELQAQEEELRVSNEELETQMRLVKESQTYTETQNARLEESNYQLQSQALILEEQKNLLESRNIELQSIRSEVETKALELEQASRYKSEFLANMSHELRTPLNSTLILAQLLMDNKEGNLNDKEVEYAKHILSSGNDLLILINDILDLSKVESGKLELNFEEFRISSVLHSLKNTFSHLASSKGIQLEIAPPVEDFKIHSDQLRLEQILKNLVSNALKFTDKGFVKVAVRKIDSDLEFAITDSGIGIPPEQQTAIFEAFKQADGTTSRKYGGTGLGLSISKSLSQLLGGTIGLSSKPKEGSTFFLRLPLSIDGRRPTPSYTSTVPEVIKPVLAPKIQEFIPDDREHTNAQKDSVIMVVEDDVKFATVMRDLVQQRGFKCVVCETAEAALKTASEFNLKFVILDIQLPDHSGLIVLDQLKRNSKTRYVPVQVISGKDFAAEAFKLGAVGYILKPVVKERLERVLAELEGKFKKANRKVLIVEDDERQQLALRQLLEDEYLSTSTVRTGGQALDAIASGDFDCVVMDLNLPDMSGFEILQNLAAKRDFNTPPVIIYTGKDLSTEEERELKRYSGSIIVKGARSPERLLDEVMLYLYRVESPLPPNHRRVLNSVRDKDQSLEGKRILLVDDDMRNIFALASGLEQKGASISIAKDGREALGALNANGDVHIILMDIMMPNMDGYEAIREIRKKKKFEDLPIIAVTAKAMKDDRDKAIEAGADDYISKPIDMERLISLIRVWTMRVS